MKTEKVVLSFIAVAIGILVAGVAFYLYQATKTIPSTQQSKVVAKQTPTPTPQKSVALLTVDSPKDEEVVETKKITVSGKTIPDATVIVTSDLDEQILTPAQNGNFSGSITIDDGENKIVFTAITKGGQESTIIRVVTYSTESF